ncbi:MAG: thioredoxin family protein, partial [Bacteroidetes bacterium]|nr:thioredoxin family protein [Bacteroidota bacterium]
CNPLIDLRILLRDQNLDIMDLYLTNGNSRSIPKLVVFDQDGNELVQWGPRPAEAQALVNKNKSEGKSKDEFIKELHLWYGRNRGKNLEEEFEKIIVRLIRQ